MYKVDFTPEALEDVSKLDKAISQRILRKIEWFAQHFEAITPQPLKGKLQGMYKLTIGDWRVLYTVDFASNVVTIHLIGHRREIYKT